MQFLVEFEAEVPARTPDEQVEHQRAESAAAAKLAEDGHPVRLAHGDQQTPRRPQHEVRTTAHDVSSPEPFQAPPVSESDDCRPPAQLGPEVPIRVATRPAGTIPTLEVTTFAPVGVTCGGCVSPS
jgi:hypothetical protein